jgi:hypothetical protein
LDFVLEGGFGVFELLFFGGDEGVEVGRGHFKEFLWSVRGDIMLSE